VKGRAVEVGSR